MTPEAAWRSAGGRTHRFASQTYVWFAFISGEKEGELKSLKESD